METTEINIQNQMSKGETEDGELMDRRNYTRSDCSKVEKTLLVYGWGRWKEILDHAHFQDPLKIEDVITIARAILMFSYQCYDGDKRIKKFIFELISPIGDIDVDGILSDEGYKKHLSRQSLKIVHWIERLSYLKTEIIGKHAEQILDGAHVSEINLPINDASVDLPIFWWDGVADKSLLVGVFKHGYKKYNLMRNDPCLCFLIKCGPPDERALLAEQNSEAEEISYEMEKKMALLPGKLRFPFASDLNCRFRRLLQGHYHKKLVKTKK